MTVQELNLVHQRYVRLSNAFKSAWTFHQFVQGMRKVFIDQGPAEYDADFQAVYGALKEISGNLNEAGVEQADRQVEEVATSLNGLNQTLLIADAQVSPGQLRQFFQRVKNYDDGILSQLVKFYLYTYDGSGWIIDRLDKADYLITKLCEDYEDGTDVYRLRDPGHVRDLSRGLWAALDSDGVSESEITSSNAEMESMRQQLAGVDSIDTLSQLRLVQTYRELKHGFGSTFFHPQVLPVVVETNLVAKNRVQELYRKEEQRIVAEYQEVFDLEREVPQGVRLRKELNEFRTAVERFEEQLQGSNIRLEELAELRRQVRDLVPRLRADVEQSGPYLLASDDGEEPGAAPVAPIAEYAYVEAQYQALIEALGGVSAQLDAKKVTLDPEIFGFGLEQREVVAYRRLADEAPCNREYETLMLRAAALRVRINHEVEEIKGLLDDSAVTRDAPIYTQAGQTVRVADQLLRRFGHLIEQAMMEGDLVEARSLQLLKMRMTRTYAGLWLLVHRP